MEPATATLRLVVGLGNPGRQYEQTRHNAGFRWIERLASERRVGLAPESRFFGIVGRLSDCWLLMPQTYMNRSGQATSALARFYRVTPEQLLVVHDELDLPAGEVRLKFGGGIAGHNGLRDIAAQLGTKDFWRLRIGIGHPRNDPQSRVEVVDYVLQRAREDEEKAIDAAIAKSVDAWPILAGGDMERAMHVLHTRQRAPKPRPPKPDRVGPEAAGAPEATASAPGATKAPDPDGDADGERNDGKSSGQ